MLKYNKNKKVSRFLLVFFLGIIIFYITTDFKPYTKIEEYSEIIKSEKPDKSWYYSIPQKYKLENVESILAKLIEYNKYKICFRDEGSFISEQAFKGSNLIILINYSNEEREVSYITYRNREINKSEICFNIVDRNNITWNWIFKSDNPITNSFLEVKESQELIIKPKVATYLKIKFIYYPLSFLLCLFYSGVFFWALVGIIRFINKGFK